MIPDEITSFLLVVRNMARNHEPAPETINRIIQIGLSASEQLHSILGILAREEYPHNHIMASRCKRLRLIRLNSGYNRLDSRRWYHSRRIRSDRLNNFCSFPYSRFRYNRNLRRLLHPEEMFLHQIITDDYRRRNNRHHTEHQHPIDARRTTQSHRSTSLRIQAALELRSQRKSLVCQRTDTGYRQRILFSHLLQPTVIHRSSRIRIARCRPSNHIRQRLASFLRREIHTPIRRLYPSLRKLFGTMMHDVKRSDIRQKNVSATGQPVGYQPCHLFHHLTHLFIK